MAGRRLELGRSIPCGCLALMVIGSWLLTAAFPETASAQRRRGTAARKAAAPKLPPLKTAEDKLKLLEAFRLSMPTRRVGRNIGYNSADLDKALESQIEASASDYAPLIDDETFIRRVRLDLTGTAPDAQTVREFVNNSDPKKRSKLIDELLETSAYARHWARYWTEVIVYDSTAPRRRLNPQALEDWFAGQFEHDVRWDRIVAELVSATPVRNRSNRRDYGQDHGPNNFVLANENMAPEIAAETARIFMGISIQCAECHDHPYDQWKHEQFHEMAAFFARGKYYMTDQYDPDHRTEMSPRFLLGETPPEGLTPDARRVAVAAYLIYNPGNYWFARSFVNRIWNELVGDGFYAVDSLGPDAEVLHRNVVNRMGAMFRYREFDPKWVFRVIMNSNAYQRDIRAIASRDKLFTAVRPSRLGPSQVAASVRNLVGPEKNLEEAITDTFRINPSLPQADMEGSIQQALLMMNNPALQDGLKESPLRDRLVQTPSDREMIEELYLGVLARTPIESEMSRSLSYLEEVGDREEAIDDLLWVLVNSTEFVTKR